MSKIKLTFIVYILFVLLAIGIAIGIDIFRWHSFQNITDSDVSYWQWHFLIRR